MTQAPVNLFQVFIFLTYKISKNRRAVAFSSKTILVIVFDIWYVFALGDLTENQISSSHPRNKRHPGDVDQLPVSSSITPEMSETATTQKDDQKNTVNDISDNRNIDSDKSVTSKGVLESEEAFAVSCANEKLEEVAIEKDTICREEKSPSPPISAPTSK